MEKTEQKTHRYGLIGRNISYSFSQGYFTEKFSGLGLHTHSYENFDLDTIEQFPDIMSQNKNIKGFNVTIPYKEKIMPFLTKIDLEAKAIGAVNTIRIVKGQTIGYNTDAYGFYKSIAPHLEEHHKNALILGTGGASKAISYVLERLRISYVFVSRNPAKGQLNYSELNAELLQKNTLIINCTPLGTFPNITDKPNIPYKNITTKHLLFDLIYNPEKTAFLLEGELQGARICNGSKMLEFQAEKAWEIWNLSATDQ
ncbi:Shikimate dehydrogenase (NADP(+)) [Arenibacter antarcticus]|uniref:Shikimate dehydrogenase family protein n=1 Tax=Arenibacter antarcticus TaxID=2040469 RepID=A0ABW5VL07_9FLAO|nr:shikimate dehydrogenase [Arenibacter sp. H213]MCM4168969.1 shikimate dehydrogenase [Arenibacter sp. H213]